MMRGACGIGVVFKMNVGSCVVNDGLMCYGFMIIIRIMFGSFSIS